jgi:hypothetical protein
LKQWAKVPGRVADDAGFVVKRGPLLALLLLLLLLGARADVVPRLVTAGAHHRCKEKSGDDVREGNETEGNETEGNETGERRE